MVGWLARGPGACKSADLCRSEAVGWFRGPFIGFPCTSLDSIETFNSAGKYAEVCLTDGKTYLRPGEADKPRTRAASRGRRPNSPLSAREQISRASSSSVQARVCSPKSCVPDV